MLIQMLSFPQALERPVGLPSGGHTIQGVLVLCHLLSPEVLEVSGSDLRLHDYELDTDFKNSAHTKIYPFITFVLITS